MSLAPWQRSAGGSAQRNGELDGWSRPPGPPPQSMTDGGGTHYVTRGVSLSCRYYVFWVAPDLRRRRDLLCNFDSLRDARAHVAAVSDVMCGGIFDRRLGRWAA